MPDTVTGSRHHHDSIHPLTDKSVVTLRRLLWIYFALWILEGALRKWVLPSLSDMLLIIRDPILLLIYAQALARGLFPRNHLLTVFVILGIVFTFVGILVLAEAPAVVLFGLRTNFLYLPLLYLIPKLWNRTHVQRIGVVVLLSSVPMALLMALQFLAAPDSWLNRGAGGNEDAQLVAALGRIRPAGTFTFVTGPPLFFALVTAFLLNAQFAARSDRHGYPPLLVGAAAVAVVIAVVVSGSRTMLASIAIVILCAVIMAALVRPRLLLRLLQAATVVAIAVMAASQFSLFQEGTATLTSRIDSASHAEGGREGVLSRAFQDFTKPFDLWTEVPIFGHGLGMGTNVGAKLLTGDNHQFLLAENEWSRVLMESGPVLGSLYLLLRLAVTVGVAGRAFRIGRLEGDVLPLLLFGTCGAPMIIGQWGQSTALGFAVFTAGLALAAAERESLSLRGPE